MHEVVAMEITNVLRLPATFVFTVAHHWAALLLALLFGCLLHATLNSFWNYQADSKLASQHGCQLPPELPKRWLFGLDRIVQLWQSNAEGHLLEFLVSIAKDYQPRNMLYQYLLVGPRAYHVLHPANLESLLSTNFTDYGFGQRPAVFAPLLGNGIFTQDGVAWRHSRELLRKQFVHAKYQHLERSFREHVDNLVARMPSTGTVDLQPLFFSLTLDAASALLFGRSVYSLRADIDQDEDNKTFAASFDVAQDGLAKRFRLAPFHSLYSPPKFRRACRNVHRYVEKYIRGRRLAKDASDPPSEEGSSWFIDQVAAESASETELRDQLLNVLLAGRDTTACCLIWTFRLLVRHEKTMERLRRELASVMGDETCATREQIRRMPFLACVIKEVLRLYPSVPLNNREAVRTTMLPTGGGPDGTRPIQVRKGEIVVFSQYVMSRMQSLYGADAGAFRPERWQTGELAGVGWAYLPFHGGPRQCLGEDFALMEISYTVVRLLQTFAVIGLPAGEAIEPVGTERQRLTLVLSSADGCRVTVGG